MNPDLESLISEDYTSTKGVEEAKRKPAKPIKSSFAADWLLPLGLIFLSFVPVLAGAVRIGQLSQGAEITPDNARFFAAPLPVLIHIVSASLYAILGALQFVPSLRRSKQRWHRLLGRFLTPFGLATALSGLWMAHFYPWPEGDGELLYVFRLVFGTGMFLALGIGYLAALKRDFKRHGQWMMRAYALGLAAGTQVFTHLPWFIFIGKPDEFPRALLMGAGWVINLAVVEWIIYKQNSSSKAQVSRLSPHLP